MCVGDTDLVFGFRAVIFKHKQAGGPYQSYENRNLGSIATNCHLIGPVWRRVKEPAF